MQSCAPSFFRLLSYCCRPRLEPWLLANYNNRTNPNRSLLHKLFLTYTLLITRILHSPCDPDVAEHNWLIRLKMLSSASATPQSYQSLYIPGDSRKIISWHRIGLFFIVLTIAFVVIFFLFPVNTVLDALLANVTLAPTAAPHRYSMN